MLPSHYRDYGLVLFHLSQVWLDGQQVSPGRTRERLEVGAEVSFYDQTLTGPQYGGLNRENILHQALVVWYGERPSHLMRKIDQHGAKYALEMRKQRTGKSCEFQQMPYLRAFLKLLTQIKHTRFSLLKCMRKLRQSESIQSLLKTLHQVIDNCPYL